MCVPHNTCHVKSTTTTWAESGQQAHLADTAQQVAECKHNESCWWVAGCTHGELDMQADVVHRYGQQQQQQQRAVGVR